MQEIKLRYKESKDPYRPGGERQNRLEMLRFFNRKGWFVYEICWHCQSCKDGRRAMSRGYTKAGGVRGGILYMFIYSYVSYKSECIGVTIHILKEFYKYNLN